MRIFKISLIVLICSLPLMAKAETETYTFDCKSSTIHSSIKYTVLGQYTAAFNDCSGTIQYDPAQKKVQSVDVQVKLKSIQSNCTWCDHAALSKRLLDARTFPEITFESTGLKRSKTGGLVRGKLKVHGVTHDLESPFVLQETPKEGKDYLHIQGTWNIFRKDFNVTWNKYLDQGGVIVGDHVLVDWDIWAKK